MGNSPLWVNVCFLGHLAYASWEHRYVALGLLEVRESEYQCKEEDSPPNSLLGNLGSADGLKTGDQMVAHHCPVSHISPSGRSGALVRISVPQGWQSSCFSSVLVGDECSRPLGDEQCLASLMVELAVLGFNGCFSLLGVRRTVHQRTLEHNPFASTHIQGRLCQMQSFHGPCSQSLPCFAYTLVWEVRGTCADICL